MVQDGMQKSPKKSKADDPFYPAFKTLRTKTDNKALVEGIVTRLQLLDSRTGNLALTRDIVLE